MMKRLLPFIVLLMVFCVVGFVCDPIATAQQHDAKPWVPPPTPVETDVPWTLRGIGDADGSAVDMNTVVGVHSAINFTWTVLAAVLVFMMQSGFALLGGFLHARHMLNYLCQTFLDTTLAGLVFWVWGFALMFGGSGYPGALEGNDAVGYSGWLLYGGAYDVNTFILWMFQMVFLTKAVVIPVGAIAGRCTFPAYIIHACFIAGVVYPIYGHWIWGGGWLSQLPIGSGALDFAGSGVVHAIGGMMGFVGAWALGPRKGKFNADGTPNNMPGHNMTYVVVGTLFLYFGWFGFNPGSTLAATDLRTSVVIVNTFLAGAAAAVVAIFVTWGKQGKPNVGWMCNGALGGLVAITAPCAWVPAWAAVVIGIIAAFIMMGSVWLLDWKLKIDDPLGAVSVHGSCGLWGIMAVGIFADGSYGGVIGCIVGSGWQLLAQFISLVIVMAWAFACGGFIWFTMKYTMGVRVSEEVERIGLDHAVHGQDCYPAFHRLMVLEKAFYAQQKAQKKAKRK
ncbi:MAG: ammonium transporter [Candidatus Brocadiales bacterium]